MRLKNLKIFLKKIVRRNKKPKLKMIIKILINLGNIGERNNNRVSSILNLYRITNKINKKPINREEKCSN